MNLIGAGRAHDEEERVDGAPFEGFAVEAEGVAGVLEEEGWWALGFGYATAAAGSAAFVFFGG